MKKQALVGSFVFGTMMILPLPLAQADPPSPHSGDPNLCASNPAFHHMHDDDNTDKHCQGVAYNDFGGGGGFDKTDTDGDGQPDGRDNFPNDPGQQ